MMTNTLLMITLPLSAYFGFAFLAVSQTRHWQAVGGDASKPSRLDRRLLRSFGIGFLLSALGAALVRDRPSFGVLLWATTISIAALTVAFTLSWRPRLLRPLAALFHRRASNTKTVNRR